MPFLRRHSAALALPAVLAAAVAAPYLIPENPDSAVFRSGVLGVILLAAAYLPVREAYARADRRTLVCGLFYGFFFAVALSLGSELRVYDGLLPGLGPAVRRAAVPVLATPLFGALAARAMLCKVRPSKKGRLARLPVWAFAAVLLVCWLPLLLAYFPGMINYDFPGQYGQHLSGQYSRLHPLLHSLLANAVITLGERLVHRTFGLFLLTALQMTLFALSLGYACAFVQRRGAPQTAVALLTALFSLHPVFSVMALSTTKDTLFAASLLVLSLETWALLEDPRAFLAQKGRCARYVLWSVCAGLLRNNGVFSLALLLPGAAVAARGARRGVCRLAGLCAGACALAFLALNVALHPTPMYSFQLYSVPAQQLVRAYNLGEMSDADREALKGWYTSELGLEVHPHLADPAKGYLDEERLGEHGGEFLSLWARNALRNPRVYAEAFLLLNMGTWYPDDVSHASVYQVYPEKGYLQTQEYDVEGMETFCLLPKVRAFYERICRYNGYLKFPLLPVLFCTASPLWALLWTVAALVARRKTRLLPAALGALGVSLSVLFGACTLARYALPLFCLAPALALLACTLPGEKEKLQ